MRRREMPGPGQESVWDYPRPPALVGSTRHVVVRSGNRPVADTRSAYRVLETTHPPTWYLPPTAVPEGVLAHSTARSTFCEWKGHATYWDVFGLLGLVRVVRTRYRGPNCRSPASPSPGTM